MTMTGDRLVDFTFPRTLEVTPGTLYYCRLEWVRGYPCWVGGRLHDFYPRGAAFGYLPNPFGGPIQNLNWGGYDLVFAAGTGRSRTGITPGEYLQWGLLRGLGSLDEFGDPDADGVSTFVEFLRDTNPMVPDRPANSRAHLIEVEGVAHLAWTVPTPVRIEYAATPEGTVIGGLEGVNDVFTAFAELQPPAPDPLRLMEVLPAASAGLPPLSPFHRYRTFRLTEPVTEVPRGFIVNRVGLRSAE